MVLFYPKLIFINRVCGITAQRQTASSNTVVCILKKYSFKNTFPSFFYISKARHIINKIQCFLFKIQDLNIKSCHSGKFYIYFKNTASLDVNIFAAIWRIFTNDTKKNVFFHFQRVAAKCKGNNLISHEYFPPQS